MSDTADLKKADLDMVDVYCPAWLYGMPQEWFETYFDLSHTCAICLIEGHG